MVDVKQGQRPVSICEQGVVMWPMEEKETGSKQAHDWDRKESTASFFNPAISFARRMSLKIIGNRGDTVVINKEKTLKFVSRLQPCPEKVPACSQAVLR